MVPTLTLKEGKTDSVGSGTTVFVLLSFVSFYMKNLLTVGIKKLVEALPLVGFFTGSLNQQTKAISSEKKTSLPSSPEIKKENN